MHSLPNDSYMFRPVMPAKPPFPLYEGELEAFSYKSPRGKASGSGPAEFCQQLLLCLNNFQGKKSRAVARLAFEDKSADASRRREELLYIFPQNANILSEMGSSSSLEVVKDPKRSLEETEVSIRHSFGFE